MTVRVRIGVDIGGTFTDFTVLGADGAQRLWKEDSTPDDPVRAIETGLRALAEQEGETVEQLLGRTDLLVHGTTIATNILIQRSGPPPACSARRGSATSSTSATATSPSGSTSGCRTRSRWCRGTCGSACLSGSVRAARSSVRSTRPRCAPRPRRSARHGVQAVAVAFLWSIANDAHERRACEILAEELPGVEVRRSSDVLPEIREWERTSATVLSAYVLPAIGAYLRRLRGAARRPHVGARAADHADQRRLLVDRARSCVRPSPCWRSGPAAAPAAALPPRACGSASATSSRSTWAAPASTSA